MWQRVRDVRTNATQSSYFIRLQASRKKQRERKQFGGLFASEKYKAHAEKAEKEALAAETRRRERAAACICTAAALYGTHQPDDGREISVVATTTISSAGAGGAQQRLSKAEEALIADWVERGTAGFPQEDLQNLEGIVRGIILSGGLQDPETRSDLRDLGANMQAPPACPLAA